MKKIFTRAVTGILSLSMIAALVVPSYASYTGSGGGSDAATGSGSWSLSKQGVRVSIVDKNGNTVLDGQSEDKNYTAIDILFSNPGTVKGMSGNKFQGMNGKDYLMIGVGSLNALLNNAIEANKYLSDLKKLTEYRDENGLIINYPKSYEGLPVPMLEGSGANSFVGNGEAVKEFFIKGSLGSFTIS